MDNADTAGQYARHEDCFINHCGYPFDIAHQLSVLQQTNFTIQLNSSEQEHELYAHPFSDPTLEHKEPPNRYEPFLNGLEERCSNIGSIPRMLPAWNDAYKSLTLPTMFLDIDFDPEIDLAVHKKQIQSKRDPDLTTAWLPVLPVDEAKDEGLQFPPRAHRLAQLLWYQLENEKTTSDTDADQKYLYEIRQEANQVVKSFGNISSPVFPCLQEDLVELDTVPVLSQQDRESSWDAKSFVSVIDLTSEPDNIGLHQNNFAVSATDSRTYKDMQTRSPSQRLPTDGSQLDYEAPEETHKQDMEGFYPPWIIDSSSLSPYRGCSGAYKSSSSQEPYTNGNEAMVMVFGDGPLEKGPPDQESIEPSISKYFVHTPASETAHEAPEIVRLETRLRNEFENLVGKGQGGGFPQNGMADEWRVGKGVQVANGSFLQPSRESKQKRRSSEDTYSTSDLLAQFMEMRGIENSRASSSDVRRPSKSSHQKFGIADQKVAEMQNKPNIENCSEQQPALAPEILTLGKPGCCLISLQLGFSMIKNLEKAWPANKLVDRDYASHLRLSDQHTSNKNDVAFVSHAHEVDVALTPNDGIIVTNFLQVKQKQLPGSTTLTSLRQRVLNLSQQYRTLIVMVSQANSSGEYIAELLAPDLAAYTDFLCFASQLAANVSVYLVPGADKTLSRWILSTMGHYSPQMEHLEDSIAFCNTKWELFFRRSGMNVRASLVLSQLLFREFGNSGLATFLGMTTEQQMTKYGVPLGLEGHIAQAGKIWAFGNKESKRIKCRMVLD